MSSGAEAGIAGGACGKEHFMSNALVRGLNIGKKKWRIIGNGPWFMQT